MDLEQSAILQRLRQLMTARAPISTKLVIVWTLLERYRALEDKIKAYNPGVDTKRLYDAFSHLPTMPRGRCVRMDPLISPIRWPWPRSPWSWSWPPTPSSHHSSSTTRRECDNLQTPPDDVRKRFWQERGRSGGRCDQLTQAGHVSKEEGEQMENLRRCSWPRLGDIRVILIKICGLPAQHAYHAVPVPQEAAEKALETMEIYAPIAHRLGMQRVKWGWRTPPPVPGPGGLREISDELPPGLPPTRELEAATIQRKIGGAAGVRRGSRLLSTGAHGTPTPSTARDVPAEQDHG